ncbi:MAG: hypothetical protein JJ959_10320 [Nisaea sp.]|uniref:hypothetical protein n=1 Tax=Nisaea sp. TaxID=2024842 RepID=UPI001AFE633F|nr:hypothetical protein [Nisaea sp.]MBO6560925.1 hypothetical protein [Nisaea sp.]
MTDPDDFNFEDEPDRFRRLEMMIRHEARGTRKLIFALWLCTVGVALIEYYFG